MGHESIFYGRIESIPFEREKGSFFLHDLNCEIIDSLPKEDEWPFLTRDMFNYPKTKNTILTIPNSIYRTPIITFGASYKDLNPEAPDIEEWNQWISKFELLISKMYWFSIAIHIEAERPLNDFLCVWVKELEIPFNKPTDKWRFKLTKR